ncbi:MAG: hypothetical protein V7642_4320, partial [Burkholderiales bacterium]
MVSGRARDPLSRILPNDYLRCLNLNQNQHSLYQTLFQTANKSSLREILADKHDFAAAYFALGPFGAKVAPHHLVHTLKDDLPVGAGHPQNTLVTQHPRPINLDQAAQHLVQFRAIERSVAFECERGDLIGMASMVVVLMCMVMPAMIVTLVMLVML